MCGAATAFWANPCGEWIYDRCTRCGHVDLRQQPSLEQLQDYYDDVYYYSQDAFARTVVRRYVTAVERATDRAGVLERRVLEVGCNTGTLLLALRDRGWEVGGTELGKRFRSVANARGLDVRPGLGDWATERFSVIVCFHVLEHVPDAMAELGAMRDHVCPGGVVVVKTPNVGCLAARLLQGEWEWSSPPAHLRLYSPSSLEQELVRAGFDVLDMGSTRGNARPFPFLAARALGLRLRGRRRRYTPGLDPRHVPVSDRPWYKAAERVGGAISLLGLPVQPLIGRLMLAPELDAVARRPC